MKKIILIPLFAVLFALISCSSTKRPMVIRTVAAQADASYEEANNLIAYGKYAMADDKLSNARNLAVSIDDAYLLTRICFSRVSYCLAMGQIEQAESEIKEAEKYYNRCSKEQKKILSGTFTIYQSRINLAKNENLDASYILMAKEKNYISEKYYLAYWNRVYGDICVALKRYGEADKAFTEAAQIHIKSRYLAEIGQDYYSLARSRSLEGKKDGAVEAIELALKYDKDAENTLGIILDYFACAKILVKDNPSENDRKKAHEYAVWAMEIAKASDNEGIIQQIEEFLEKN